MGNRKEERRNNENENRTEAEVLDVAFLKSNKYQKEQEQDNERPRQQTTATRKSNPT